MWLYWIPALAACLFVPLFALAFDETAPLLRFRKHVAEMERIGGGWMPEPAPPPCPWKVVRHHVLQPYRVLGTHWLVPLSTATALIFLGALVLAMNGVVAVWVEEHGMSLIIAQGALTACGGIGLLAAALLAALFYSRPSTLAPSRRPLHIDEKGFIDSAPAAPLPEQLLFPVLCSAPAAAFSKPVEAGGRSIPGSDDDLPRSAVHARRRDTAEQLGAKRIGLLLAQHRGPAHRAWTAELPGRMLLPCT